VDRINLRELRFAKLGQKKTIFSEDPFSKLSSSNVGQSLLNKPGLPDGIFSNQKYQFG
jgi:hypothetical protein